LHAVAALLGLANVPVATWPGALGDSASAADRGSGRRW
jgi:hypothetical protein